MREYLAFHYGQVFLHGGTAERYFAGVRLAKRLARMIGADLEAVIATARADAEVIFA